MWPNESVTLVTNWPWNAISWVAFAINKYKILTKWFGGCVLVFCSHFSVFCFSHWVEIKSHWVLSRSFPWWEFFKNTKYFISHNSYSKTTLIKICNESSCNQVVPKSPKSVSNSASKAAAEDAKQKLLQQQSHILQQMAAAQATTSKWKELCFVT